MHSVNVNKLMNEWKYLFTRKASLNSSRVHTRHHIHRFYFYLTDHTRKTILHERIIWNDLRKFSTAQVYTFLASSHRPKALTPNTVSHQPHRKYHFQRWLCFSFTVPAAVTNMMHYKHHVAYSPKISPLPCVSRLGDLSEPHCIHLETQRLRNSISLQLWNSWIAWNV